MDELLHQIEGQTLPRPPADFRERVERRANPILNQRRRVRTVRRVAMAAAAAAALVSLPVLLVRAPETSKETARTELDRLSTEELLQRHAALMGEHARESASMVYIPIDAIIESTDVIVQGVVEEATVDREQLIKDLLKGRAGSVYLDVRFHVVESCPSLEENSIVVRGTGGPAQFQPGAQYLMALNRAGDAYRPIYGFQAQGIYPIHSEAGETFVPGVLSGQDRLSLPEAWKVIRTYHDRIHGQASLPQNELQQYLAALNNGSLDEAIVAFEVVAGDPDVNTLDLLNALQRQHERLFAAPQAAEGSDSPSDWSYEQKWDLSQLTCRFLEVCCARASEHEVDQVLDWCMGHVPSLGQGLRYPHDFAEAMLRLALKYPGPARRQRVLSILGREVEYFDERNRLSRTIVVPPASYALRLIARTSGEDMEVLLIDLFAKPDVYRLTVEFDPGDLDRVRAEMFSIREQHALSGLSFNPEQRILDLMEIYTSGNTHPYIRDSILYRIQPGDYSKIEFLRSLPIESVAWVLAAKVPDAAFIPVLLERAEQGSPLEPYLDALGACGGAGEALEIARGTLEGPYPAEDMKALASDVYARCAALRFLGNTGDDSLVSLVRSSITSAKLAALHEEHVRAFSKEFLATEPNRRPLLNYSSPEKKPLDEALRVDALLALTKLGDRSVASAWEDLYNGDDIRKRITAAVALFYLGEDTGSELIEAFARHAERDDRDVHALISAEGNHADFQHAIAYLRSPETDALFLERLEYACRDGDRDLILDGSFLADHADTVLPLLIEHLEHRDWKSRREAASSLEQILGVQVEWDEFALAGTQPEKVDRLRVEADTFLAGWTSRNR